MELKDRNKDILDILYAKGKVSVSELSQTLYVSEMTIRRDLNKLQKDGIIKRYRGGAILSGISSEMPISQRFFVDEKEKIALSKKAIQYLHNDLTVFIDSSSTCQYIIPYISRFSNVTIITNSVNALLIASKSQIPCIMIGGEYCYRDMCFTGSIAEEYASQFNVDVAFFSALGLSADGIISDSDIRQSMIRKIIIQKARKSIFLFEKSKINNTYFYTICHKNDIFDVITLP